MASQSGAVECVWGPEALLRNTAARSTGLLAAGTVVQARLANWAGVPDVALLRLRHLPNFRQS
jgi:hypothetical protein